MNPERYVTYRFQMYSLIEKCSAHLLRQCTHAYSVSGAEPEMVADAIRSIDMGSRSNMRVPEQFKKLPLKGYWKAHFWGGGAPLIGQLAQNMLNETDQKWYQRRVEKYVSEHEGELFSEDHSHYLADLLTQKTLDARAQRGAITGEWIVFEKGDYGNRYLTVAMHGEDDQAIYERICAAKKEMNW